MKKTPLLILASLIALATAAFADLSIIEVEANSPDYVVIKNSGGSSVDLTGYSLVEDDSDWTFPKGASIAAGSTVKVFCYSKKKKLAEGSQAASKWANTPNVFVSIEFGISDKELIELKNPSGQTISSAVSAK